MSINHMPGTWEAKLNDTTWQVLDEGGRILATIANIPDAESKAKQIAISPYMLEALKAVVELIGDDDLPDNGELSGEAVCDMLRAAVELASS